MAVTMIDRAFLTYKHLYTTLHRWASQYCDEAGARKVAAHTIASAFKLAVRGWETSSGPLAECVEIGVRYMSMYMDGRMPDDWRLPQQSVPPVDEHFIKDLGWLWATVYESIYIAQFCEYMIQEVAMLILVSDPRDVPAENLERTLALKASDYRPLVQILAMSQAADGGRYLVCDIGDVIEYEETTKGLDWWKDDAETVGGPL